MKKSPVSAPTVGQGASSSLLLKITKSSAPKRLRGYQPESALSERVLWLGFPQRHPPSDPRLTRPLIRYQKGGKFTPVSWDEAIRYTAQRLLEIRDSEGPRAIMTTGSSRGTGNETNYVMQKFARAVLNTNNVDCCAASVTGRQWPVSRNHG